MNTELLYLVKINRLLKYKMLLPNNLLDFYLPFLIIPIIYILLNNIIIILSYIINISFNFIILYIKFNYLNINMNLDNF
jgi:hypothetical protein